MKNRSNYEHGKINTIVGQLISGRVTTGKGRGAKFISLPIYSRIFEEILGEKPFPGTLNLIVLESSCDLINQAFEKGKNYQDIEYEGKTYGGIIVIGIELFCKGQKLKVTGVRPLRTTHNSNVVEIVSQKNLREFFSLKDADQLEFSFVYPLLDKLM